MLRSSVAEVLADGGGDTYAFGCEDAAPDPATELVVEETTGGIARRTFYRLVRDTLVHAGDESGANLRPLRSCDATVPASPYVPPGTPADVSGPAYGDVDGDREYDRIVLVEQGQRSMPNWRWGVRVESKSTGNQIAWRPEGELSNEGQRIAGVVDLDLDGRAEVVVNAGSSATSTGYLTLTVVGTKLVWLHLQGETDSYYLEAGEIAGTRGWGCADGRSDFPGREVYVVEVTADGDRRLGTRTYYSLLHGALVKRGSTQASWGENESPPSGYEAGARCDSIDE
jgi:hypothetical protein